MEENKTPEASVNVTEKKKRKWMKWALVIVVVLALISVLNKPREVKVTEAALNAKLAEGLNKPGDNPIVAANIDLREDIGTLTMEWQKGQKLTADIVVSPNGLLLVSQNVNITGAGALNDVFEGVAKLALTNILTNVSISQRNLVKIEINPDELVGHYARR